MFTCRRVSATKLFVLLLVVALVVQSEAGWTRFRFRGRRIRDRLERAARYIRDKVRPGSKLSFPINTRTHACLRIFLFSCIQLFHYCVIFPLFILLCHLRMYVSSKHGDSQAGSFLNTKIRLFKSILNFGVKINR